MRFTTILLLSLFLSMSLQAKKKGAPAMAAGAPGDRTCFTSKCHAGNDLNSDKATISIDGLPAVYTANEIYEITIQIEQKGAKRFGFQTTVADADGEASGTLMTVEGQNTRILSNERYKSKTNRQYLTHTLRGINAAKKGVSQSWKIQWQAPEAGTSSFFFAFNAANGNKKKTGDYIYTRTIEVKPAK